MKKPSEKTWNDFLPLLDECSEISISLLKKQKELFPICLYLDSNHKVNVPAIYTGDEHPDTNELIKEYKNLLKTFKVKAACIAYMVTVKNDSIGDALCIDFNHINGDVMRCLIPYSFHGIIKKMNVGERIFSEESIKIL
ncbi:MAG: hypothetical protein WCF91_03010 [bacterium]|jgi:hypothetical protein